MMPTENCPKCGRAIMAGVVKLQKRDQPPRMVTFMERHMEAEHGPNAEQAKRGRRLGALFGR